MKYSAILCLLIVFACGCSNNNLQAALLSEQKLLKDSANNVNERIGSYVQRGVYDSAEAQKKQLAAVYARLIDIQSSLDSVANIK